MPIVESLYTLQPDVVDLLFIKLWFMLGQTVQVWKIKGLNAMQIEKIYRFIERICDHCTTLSEKM